jgi:hypothetical protein
MLMLIGATNRIRAVLAVNGSAIARYEAIARAALERGWEFIGHGFTQKSMQKVADERDDIRKTAAAIREFTGRNPRGWLGPGLTETWETPDLLVEEGYEYVCDWVLDDEPVLLGTRTKPIVGIPYTQECNDGATMLIQHHKAGEYYDRAVEPVRAALPRRGALGPHHGVGGAPLHHGCAAPPQILPRRPRPHPRLSRRAVLDRRGDPRLVPGTARMINYNLELHQSSLVVAPAANLQLNFSFWLWHMPAGAAHHDSAGLGW